MQSKESHLSVAAIAFLFIGVQARSQTGDVALRPTVPTESSEWLKDLDLELTLLAMRLDTVTLDDTPDGEAPSSDGGGGEGSNPLSSTNKLDLIWVGTGAGDNKTHDLSAEGSFMLHPKVKLSYELHYLFTDVTGSDEDDWQNLHLKPIFFPHDAKLNDDWGMRVAAGFEWILDFDNAEKGIGSGSDVLAPLFALAFANKKEGLTLIPLVQHFLSYDGPSVNATAARIIALKSLPENCWLKIDAKLLYNWETDATPIVGEVELGKMLSPKMGIFGKGLIGVGDDRAFDWGIGAGLRMMF